jgi:hypothetical protein
MINDLFVALSRMMQSSHDDFIYHQIINKQSSRDDFILVRIGPVITSCLFYYKVCLPISAYLDSVPSSGFTKSVSIFDGTAAMTWHVHPFHSVIICWHVLIFKEPPLTYILVRDVLMIFYILTIGPTG